jgi:hypothetical protein
MNYKLVMKKIIIFLVFFSPSLVDAQKDSTTNFRRIFVSANIGISIPMNGFYTQTVETYGNYQYGSFADVGYTANILGEIPI